MLRGLVGFLCTRWYWQHRPATRGIIECGCECGDFGRRLRPWRRRGFAGCRNPRLTTFIPGLAIVTIEKRGKRVIGADLRILYGRRGAGIDTGTIGATVIERVFVVVSIVCVGYDRVDNRRGRRRFTRPAAADLVLGVERNLEAVEFT